MTDEEGVKTASEIINEFFSNLTKIEGMDEGTATIIQRLWKEGRLGRDELINELQTSRATEARHD